MFPKLANPIYDMDLTERNKYQKDLLYLDLQGLKLNRPPQPFFNKKYTEKVESKEDKSIFRMKNDRFYNNSLPNLPPLYILRPIKKDPRDNKFVKGFFIQNHFDNYKKLL